MHSYHPLEQPETSALILWRLSCNDLLTARLVSKTWCTIASEQMILKKLMGDFNLPEALVVTLSSPQLVYSRLQRIMARGKTNYLQESELYQLYCASGNINTDFIHLLDNNTAWFAKYFYGRDIFFLASHLHYACIAGNDDLVKYLIEVCRCPFESCNVMAAIASGNAPLTHYLLKNQSVPLIDSVGNSTFSAALAGDNLEVFLSLKNKYHWQVSAVDFRFAVRCASLNIVRNLHDTDHFSASAILIDNVLCYTTLPMIKYLVEELNWRPCADDNLNDVSTAGYSLGRVDIVKCLASQFVSLSTSWLHIMRAIESGDLATFKYALQQAKLSMDDPMSVIEELSCFDPEDVLRNAIQSGSLEIVRFFVEACDLKPVPQEYLSHAVATQSLPLLRYLHDACALSVCMQDLLHDKVANLEVSEWVINVCKDFSADQLTKQYIKSNSLMTLYHLITKGKVPVNDEILRDAYSAYLHSNHNHLLKYFIRYLINVHHLKPSQDMIDHATIREDNDMRMAIDEDYVEGNKRQFTV